MMDDENDSCAKVDDGSLGGTKNSKEYKQRKKLKKELKKEKKRQKKQAKKERKKRKRHEKERSNQVISESIISHTVRTVGSSITDKVDCKKDENALFLKQRIDITITLHQMEEFNHDQYRNQVQYWIQENHLLKYTKQFKGVLLAFDHFQMNFDESYNTSHGGLTSFNIMQKHCAASCTALIFMPKPGLEIIGEVNQLVTNSSFQLPTLAGVTTEWGNSVSSSLPNASLDDAEERGVSSIPLQLIVYNYFNASISANEMRKCGMFFDTKSKNWVCHSTNKHRIKPGTKVRFLIAKVHETAGIISIEGSQPVVLE